METTNNKKRTPSRCREWERQRRNKFNDAISKLGAIVKEIIRSNDPPGKETENVQFPKLEIVQKALLCLNNFVHENEQLKAEILAQQVKLDTEINRKIIKKDASSQVFFGLNKKSKNKRYEKLLVLKKSKCSNKEKSRRKNIDKSLELTPNFHLQKLPKLLPRSSFYDIKGPENAIVVLPATPYIFPQRPLLFPTIPPAFVLVDHNLQALNKTTIPTVSRNTGDVTKTTMVNILPISAYSRPLSATKAKKPNTKTKGDSVKKSGNKAKVVTIKCTKESTSSSTCTSTDEIKEDNFIENRKNTNASTENKCCDEEVSESAEKQIKKTSDIKVTLTEENNIQIIKNNNKICNDIKSPKTGDAVHINFNRKCTESNKTEKISTIATTSKSVTKVRENITTEITEECNKTDKLTKVPETIPENKSKGNKLPNILESSLCDNVVDGGNARLELAEEFLAASPTAAFLMSFPLVSGNRADSPAEEPQNTVETNTKDDTHRRNELTPQSSTYFDKHSNCSKAKSTNKILAPSPMINKQTEQQKFINNNMTKPVESKTSNIVVSTNLSTENPFLNLPMPSLAPTNCPVSDTVFGMDFDCNISKAPISTQSSSYGSNNNIFYKSDPFSTVKSTIYSTSNISSHEFNGLGLYPCAMEKYTSKNKPDFTNVEDNLMKIGSSRLTYDIDLGWSHKGFDFVNCTTSANTYNKDNILTTSAPYSTTYNPFTPDFHVPLVSTASKKENIANKVNSSFAESITSFYSQPTNLWAEDTPFYTNNTMPKTFTTTTKHQNYLPLDHTQTHINVKPNIAKHYETKQISEAIVDNLKPSNIGSVHTTAEKYTKKSPSKMHINWMTSEIRPMQNNCTVINTGVKESHKAAYSQLDNIAKKHDPNEGNYFPISMHNFSTQPAQEEFQVWPSARPLGTTEISIDPPPINLPTLVGDLALGPHDKKKNAEVTNRTVPQPDVQNCGNFLSVTQLMNRSTDNLSSRYHGPNINQPKSVQTKLNIVHFNNDPNRKSMSSRLESHVPQPCYVFNEPKTMNSYENTVQFSQSKSKTNNKTDKSSKSQKNNYSAESLIRGGTCTQKVQDSNNLNKFMMPSQKYNDFNAPQDSSVAQVSHFPPLLDYSDNSYTGQQFSGTTLYNSSTNTISNSFYSNFMPGSSNLMSGNYTSGPFTSDFTDFNQTPECSYTYHKYEELKMRNNASLFQPDKVPSNYKSSRRESTSKHKLECSKKESSKKYQNKRAKLHNDAEEWSDPSHLLWQNKTSNKRHSNLLSEEIPFPNYVGNQMPAQYQPDIFNSHFMPSNVQNVGHNVDRSIGTFPATSRANFNLSTIFPEITMKVQ